MVTQRDIECATKCVEECAYTFGLTENDLPDAIEAMQQIIADHVAQETKALREALEKISGSSKYQEDPNRSPSDSYGNYDDCYYDGYDQATYDAAAIARGALHTPAAKGE